MSEYDSTYVFMPLSEAQLYFNSPDAAQAVEVYLDDPDEVGAAPRAGRGGRQAAGLHHRLAQRNVTFFNALQVERNVMFLILALIVLVAALNIISGLIMLVKDKGRDIAILRTMGATSGAIMRVFFITGASIGTVGTLAGSLSARSSALNIEIAAAVRQLGDARPRCSRPSSISSPRFRPRWIRARRSRSPSWRWRYPISRRSIRLGVRRGSIPSRRCATNERRAKRRPVKRRRWPSTTAGGALKAAARKSR